MNKKKPVVLVLGAFDRYNYGDLLFPHIIRKEFEYQGIEVDFEFYGLIESDLSAVGGVQTKSIKEFYKRCNAKGDRPVSVIIAGGETLNATWGGLNSFLSPSFRLAHKLFLKAGLSTFSDVVAKQLLGGKTRFPLTFEKGDFSNVRLVVGNSLGGSFLNQDFFDCNPGFIEILRNFDYLSVREGKTCNTLRNQKVNVNLVPDSALLMSNYFSKDFLEQKVDSALLNFVKNNNYLFFQVKRAIYQKYRTKVISELENIGRKTGLTICLCPIGVALGHEDQFAIEDLKRELSVPFKVFSDVKIWEIMYLIAGAKCYIGTSLHGLITAMSFSVPYVGIGFEILKVDSYLKTWGIESLNKCSAAGNFASSAFQALSVSKLEIKQKTEEQIHTVQSSFVAIKNLILEEV